MTIELYEGNKSLYLCIVNHKGGCLAVRLFDVYDGSPKDGGKTGADGSAPCRGQNVYAGSMPTL